MLGAGSLSGCITLGGQQIIELANENSVIANPQQLKMRVLANEIANPPWPLAAKLNVTKRVLSGVDASPQMSSVDRYLIKLTSKAANLDEYNRANFNANSRAVIALRDANQQLSVAQELVLIARESSRSLSLTTEDIKVIETAILDLRTNRTVFIDTLKALNTLGEPVALNDINSVKRQFVNTGRALGSVADMMSETLAILEGNDRTPLLEDAPVYTGDPGLGNDNPFSDFTQFQ